MATTITRRQIREGASSDLGLNLAVTAVTVDSTNLTVTIPDLWTKLPDPDHLRDAFITCDGDDYARIVRYNLDAAPNYVTLSKIPTGMTDSAACMIYFLISPEDWNTQLNNALEKLGRMVRVDLTISNDTSDYVLDDTVLDSDNDECTWIQSRGQIFDVQTKFVNGNYTQIEGWAGVSFLEDNNQITVHFSYLPQLISTVSLRVRKPYVWRDRMLNTDLIADEDSTHFASTVCPYELAVEAVKEKAMELIFNRYGSPTMRQRFAAMLQVTRDRLAAAKLRYEPPMRPSSYQVEETFFADIPVELQYNSWSGNTWLGW